ncbi:MAG: hypothetical protein PUE85_01795 [Firmicutes bacterium]|nr:hypothetical protein [Bacillota bacterium]
MENGRYRKVRDITLNLDCPGCPVKPRRATFLFDTAKNLPLLQVFLENTGRRVIKGVYLKLVYYDNFGNVVPDNGKSYKICGFLNLDFHPGATEGAHKVIILPGDEVVDCDVFVTKVICSNNETLLFNDSDYILPSEIKPRKTSSGSKKRSGKLVLAGLLASALLIYMLVALGTYLFKGAFVSPADRSAINNLIETNNYEDAMSRAEKTKNSSLISEVAEKAVDYYLGESDAASASLFVSKLSGDKRKSELAASIAVMLKEEKDFVSAKELAESCEEEELKEKIISEAVEYYCGNFDYDSALEFASASEDAEQKRRVYDEAIKYFVSQENYSEALDYAIKTGDVDAHVTIYDAAILQYYENGDYNSAALYIAKSGEYVSGKITSSLIDQIFVLADPVYIRTHLDIFYDSMSFARKQALFASVIDVYKEAVGVTNSKRVAGTSAFTFTNISSIDTSEFHTVGLKKDGTVVASGNNTYRQCATSGWSNIVAIAAGEWHTAAVRSDGTAVATGSNENRQCNVTGWRKLVDIAAGRRHTVGLRSDGTVVACGSNDYGQCDVSSWTDIIAIACGDTHTVGLKKDGTVVATGNAAFGRCSVSSWTDIVAISAGDTHTVGLRSNGTVVMTGHPYSGTCGDVSSWTDVVAISAGSVCTMGLTSSGTILITGDGAPDVSGMLNIAVPGAASDN